jgi:hypothetical protein
MNQIERDMSHLRITPSYAELNNNTFRLRVIYDHCEESMYSHRYTIECIDNKNLTTIIIDSNVIDDNCEVSLEEALVRTKYYLKDRFSYEISVVTIIPEVIQRWDNSSKKYITQKPK